MIVASMPAILGFNVLSGIQPMGAGSTIMDLWDFLVSYNILPLGGLVFVLFCSWKNGWGWKSFQQEVNSGKGIKLPNMLKNYLAYVLPWIIVFIYLKGYYDTFISEGIVVLIVWMVFACLLLTLIFWVALKNAKKKYT